MTTAPLIVHVFPSFAAGGAQMRFAALANHFGRRFRHMVIALDGDLSCRAQLRADLDINFPTVAAPKNAMLANALRFRRLLRRWRPHLLITCNWGAIEFALANLIPVCRHVHVVDGFGPDEQFARIPRRNLLRRLALRGSTTILPSRTLLHIAHAEWHLPEHTLRAIPNGIDTARFATSAQHSGLVVGTAAALRPEKNIGRLIRAFARCDADAARLVIAGDGPERAILAALRDSLGLRDRVTFLGHCTDMPGVMAGFDVFALSSNTEQMPLSVLEAMAAGKPIAATDVGDVRAMVANDNAPFIVALDDDALAGALRTLLQDPTLRLRLGAANHAKVRDSFDQARMFAAWERVWTGEAA